MLTRPRKSFPKGSGRNIQDGGPLFTAHGKHIHQKKSQAMVPIQAQQQPLQTTDTDFFDKNLIDHLSM